MLHFQDETDWRAPEEPTNSISATFTNFDFEAVTFDWAH